jgi:hypothetical protein
VGASACERPTPERVRLLRSIFASWLAISHGALLGREGGDGLAWTQTLPHEPAILAGFKAALALRGLALKNLCPLPLYRPREARPEDVGL